MSNSNFLSLKKQGLIALFMCVWSVICFAQQDSLCSLKIDVTGIGKTQGTLYVVLYDEAGYMKDKLQVKNINVKNCSEPYTFTFDGLQKGSYAVVMFLDENGNGKTDRNGMGMPTEMIGFSNNAQCLFGPPSFKDTEISLDGDKTIKVVMYYYHM